MARLSDGPPRVVNPEPVLPNLPVSSPKPAQTPIRVIAYNVHLLPDLAAPFAGRRGTPKYRATAIAKQLVSYDVVGLSEAFDPGYTQALVSALQAESGGAFHIAIGPKRSGRHLIGGGLLLLSRYPIIESNTRTYQHASRFLTSGFQADGFAAKGALHARILVNENSHASFDCFLTHLESQSTEARDQQILELASFMREHTTAELPVLAMGDFNVPAGVSQEPESSSSYQHLVQHMKHEGLNLVDVGRHIVDGPLGTSNALSSDGGRRIDYIFTSHPNPKIQNILHPLRAEHRRLLDSRVPEGSLSDHLAVVCEFQFSQASPQTTAQRP